MINLCYIEFFFLIVMPTKDRYRADVELIPDMVYT